MTKALTRPGRSLILYLGAESGETVTYTAPCAFPEKSFEFAKTIEEEAIPDCDDPSKAPWIEGEVSGRQLRINGSGMMAETSLAMWNDAWESDDPILFRGDLVKTDGSIVRWSGKLHVENLQFQAPGDHQKIRISVNAQSHGEVARTAEAAPT